MSDPDATTRSRLIESAARLFRQKGYNGTGLSEVLEAARAPKGSLYHHFPKGKADLALAAADWTSDVVLRVIDDAFAPAPGWRDGATTFCHKLAKLFDISDAAGGCPISAMLFDGPDSDAFRAHAARIFGDWTARVAEHALRLGLTEREARQSAETLIIMAEGCWTLARVRRNSDVIRSIPARLFGEAAG